MRRAAVFMLTVPVAGLLAGLLQLAAWRASGPLFPGWSEPISNVLHVASAPGWAVVLRSVGYFVGSGFWSAAASGAITATAIIVFWLLLERTAGRGSPRASGRGVSRRALVLGGAAGVVTPPAGLAAYASAAEPWSIRTVTHDVPVADLPPALDGLRIVQLTDTHLGPRVPAWHIRAAVDRALAMRADLVCLTGDYVHRGAARIDEAIALLAPLARAAPTVAVLGNHDHYSGAPDRIRSALAAAGAEVIENRAVFLDANRRLARAGGLCIAGVGDLEEGEVDLASALRGVARSVPRIVLSHNPDVVELPAFASAEAPRTDLVLCGHTHGGQVALPLLGRPVVPSLYGERYAHGLVRGPRCPVVISAGVGMSVLPVRVGVPPEVTLTVLRRA